jgi:DNA-binding FadR family transcriptional regulator
MCNSLMVAPLLALQIEMVWGKTKDWLKRQKDEVSAMEPHRAIYKALTSVRKRDCRRFMRHSAKEYCQR